MVAAALETGRGNLSWLRSWLHPCKGSSGFSAGVACRDKAEIPYGCPTLATGQHPPSKHQARTTSHPAILYPQPDNRWTGLFVACPRARAGRVSACRVSLLLGACLSHPCLTATSAHRPSPCRGSGQRSLPPIHLSWLLGAREFWEFPRPCHHGLGRQQGAVRAAVPGQA